MASSRRGSHCSNRHTGYRVRSFTGPVGDRRRNRDWRRGSRPRHRCVPCDCRRANRLDRSDSVDEGRKALATPPASVGNTLGGGSLAWGSQSSLSFSAYSLLGVLTAVQIELLHPRCWQEPSADHGDRANSSAGPMRIRRIKPYTRPISLVLEAQSRQPSFTNGLTNTGPQLGLWTLIAGLLAMLTGLPAAGVFGGDEQWRWRWSTATAGLGSGVTCIAFAWIFTHVRSGDMQFLTGIGVFLTMVSGLFILASTMAVLKEFRRSKVYGDPLGEVATADATTEAMGRGAYVSIPFPQRSSARALM